MLTGVVWKDEHQRLWFDDVAVHGPQSLPRTPAFSGTLWYTTSGVSPQDLAAVLGGQDEAFGPKPGQLAGIKVRCEKRGSYRVLMGTTWGVDRKRPEEVREDLEDLMVKAASHAVRWKGSAAGTSISAYLDRYDGKEGRPALKQLPARWRSMAHAAIHGGPIVVCKGSLPNAAHIDISSAYLAALLEPMPVLGRDEDGNSVGGWWTWDDPQWDDVRKMFGLVEATVRVDRDKVLGWQIPPLPIHLPIGTIMATGRIRGVWTIDLVREAEERGEVTVEKVHQFCHAPVREPIFAAMAEDFSKMPKALGKKLYTRFWGKMASRGGFKAERRALLNEGEVPSLGLAWRWDGVTWEGHKAPPTYRPDVAAFVVGHTYRKVLEALRALQPGSVAAVHVDAIWSGDVKGAKALCSSQPGVGDWKLIHTGPLRFYGTGIYDHNGRLGASGYNDETLGPLTPEGLRNWAENHSTARRLLLVNRTWTADPALDPHAESTPLDLDLADELFPVGGPDVTDKAWTRGGWMKQPAEVDAVSQEADAAHQEVDAAHQEVDAAHQEDLGAPDEVFLGAGLPDEVEEG